MTTTDDRSTRVPNPFEDQKAGTLLGDYVTVPLFGHRGRVSGVHYECPEADWWKVCQQYDVAAEEQRTKRWVSILLEPKGSVVFPETMVEPTEPFVLHNNYAPLYWGAPKEDPNG